MANPALNLTPNSRVAPAQVSPTSGFMMTLEMFLQTNMLRSDLEVVDSHFAKIGITDLNGVLLPFMLQLHQ